MSPRRCSHAVTDTPSATERGRGGAWASLSLRAVLSVAILSTTLPITAPVHSQPASRLNAVVPDPTPTATAPLTAQSITAPEPPAPAATPEQEIANLRAYSEQLLAQLTATQQEHRMALSQLTVSETTRAHLADELAQAQAEVSRLRQGIAFYERVIPAAGSGPQLQIRSAEIRPLGDNLLQYRVLVMRNQSTGAAFQGELQFLATGKQDGSSATIALEESNSVPTSGTGMTPPPAANTTPGLRFQQYQRAAGLLAIPPGFTPVTITVRVLEGKTVRAEHTVKVTQEPLS